jgi:putative transposase
LAGPERGVSFQLYVLLDIYSRYVPGWVVAEGESGELAETMIADAVARNGAAPGALHADRGGAMTSKPVAQLLVDLGVDRSHSRPRVSNDNPFSESQFKTLKYFPEFPDRFGSAADARAFCERFFNYYNHEHRHRALGLHIPASVHFGTATQIRAQRALVLEAAYARNPLRSASRPVPPDCPKPPGSTSPLRRHSYRTRDETLS